MADTEQADLDLWRKLATKERKGADPDGLVWHTPEGIDVKPLYSKADVAKLVETTAEEGAFSSVTTSERSPGTSPLLLKLALLRE